MGILVILLIVLASFALVLAFLYNSLVALRNRVRNAWSQIAVQLRRRHDLIPNLVEAVKGYMKYEQETLQKVIAARSQAVSAKGIAEIAKAEGELGAVLGRLFALFERYPELKANENVMRLQEELTTTENQIAFARQFYNDSVMKLNNKIQQFPTNIVASMFNFREREFFEAPPAVKEPPKVDLTF